MNTDLKTALYETLRSQGKAMSVFELSNMTESGIEAVQPLLNDLCAEGKIAITKKGKYAVPEQMGLIGARAAFMRSGAAIALPTDGAPSLKIVPRGSMRIMPNDVILVRRAGPGECELVSIVRRSQDKIAAFIRVEFQEGHRPQYRRSHQKNTRHPLRKLIGIPCDRRIPYSIAISGEGEVHNDEIALLAIDQYPEGNQPIRGHVLRTLGSTSDMKARLKVIAENHDFSTEFPEDVDLQCREMKRTLSPNDLKGREDLRDLLTFTIDGPLSKDFDDAVSLERTESGDWRLGVHIADVSHYVQPGSPIDREALERGTSLYLPALTVPMLPEILSNDLCSLMPDTDRLALSCFMVIRNGKTVDHHLCRSVIRSDARLTYDAVNRLFDGDSEAIPAELHETLSNMKTLSRELRAARFSNGCIDLDLPETEFVLNEESIPTDILSTVRGESERMIEDFMLTANETVARLAKDTATPLVYRVHEAPDPERLETLKKYLSTLNVHVHMGANPHSGVLQKIIETTKTHPASESIRTMLLRSMQHAIYSEKPLGHYALAMEDYCHFTSPIRRYPDLIVHRMMKQLLDGKVKGKASKMAEFARQSSDREQESTYAEREADDLMKARFMQDRVGSDFDGLVTGVTGWGLYVTLDNSVEGLVHIATLDDYYDFDRENNRLICANSGIVFKMGDRVRIRVDSVDVDRGEINFRLRPPKKEERRSAPEKRRYIHKKRR